jgi:ubiquinone/menaquinone biosynthesis C-methylase UbiE
MSDSSPDIARGFRDVDAEPDPRPFRDYLERMSTQLAAEKAANHRLLEPSPGRRLLDVGCGTGGDVRALAELVAPTGLVVGVDRSDALVEEARAVSAGACAEFVAADAAALPFETGSFDGARVERTLQHVEDPAVVLEEMKRVVRPAGILVAAEPDWGTLTIAGADAATTRTVCDTLCRQHIRHGWIGRQLVGHFTRLGLEDIDVRPLTLVVRSFPIAADVFRLAQAGSDPWLADLRSSDAHGTFFASLTGFTVIARTP